MNSSPLLEIVSSIADLTDNQDLLLLERSLLDTLNDIFKPSWVALYRCQHQHCTFAIALHNSQLVQQELEIFQQAANGLNILYTPVMGKTGEVLGYLRLARDNDFSPVELDLLKNLSRIYDNFLTALRVAQTDKLTGLLNRHTFDAQLDRALEVIRKNYVDGAQYAKNRKLKHDHGCFFIGILDIDHFKNINDKFGHLYGDEVLIIMAQLLKTVFRADDLIYRFGGEEFVVIIYVESAQDAFSSFERLRKCVEQHDFPQVGHVSISVGYTQMLPNNVPVELIGRADQALYYAKNHGRNRCCCYEELLNQQQVSDSIVKGEVTLF